MIERDSMAGEQDVLSPLAGKLLNLDRAAAYQKLVVDGPGNQAAKGMLEGLAPAQLLSAAVREPEMGRGLLAGLWLWHDWLDESHEIAQSMPSPTGSFWHAIMHRREGDFNNSKYWYARAGRHPIFDSLGVHAAQALNPLPADKTLLRVLRDGWDADALVDLVQELHAHPNDARLPAARALQQIEWRLLFEHCARHAASS
jgi:hypothetical protein